MPATKYPRRPPQDKIKAVTEYLEYHGSTRIKVVKQIWWPSPSDPDTKYPMWVARFTDEHGERLSGFYIEMLGKNGYYIAETDAVPPECEKCLIKAIEAGH